MKNSDLNPDLNPDVNTDLDLDNLKSRFRTKIVRAATLSATLKYFAKDCMIGRLHAAGGFLEDFILALK
jgi:hypothetical protein